MSTPYHLPSDTSKVEPFEWDDHYDFPRDLVGYGENSFNPQWPGGAKIAVSFVINYEEVYSLPFTSSLICIPSNISTGRRAHSSQRRPPLRNPPLGSTRRNPQNPRTRRKYRVGVRIRLTNRCLASLPSLQQIQLQIHPLRRWKSHRG
jgi:hypothetical protein